MNCSTCKKTLLDKPIVIHYENFNTTKYTAHVCSKECHSEFTNDIAKSHVFQISKRELELTL